MKLKINQASDLSSISVFPPPSRSSSLMPPAAPQIRSMSQQSISQGMSFSQLSQSSFDEALFSDQRLGSQEKDNSSRRTSLVAPNPSTREDSQLQLSRASNNALQRWKSASAPDNRGQVNQESEQRFQHIESSIGRLVMIMESVQSDVMHANRALKEVLLETEGIRQKIFLLENSMQQVLKGEENIKVFLDERLKSISDQMIKESNHNKLNDIAATLSDLPKQIEASLLRLQREFLTAFIKETETRSYNCTRQSQRSQIPINQIPVPLPSDPTRKVLASKMDAKISKAWAPKLTNSKHSTVLKQEELPFVPKEQDCRIIISDEESDSPSCGFLKKETGRENILMEEAKKETMRILQKARKSDGPSCGFLKKDTGWENILMEEAEKETMRILQKARKRKRRQSNFVVLV